MFRRLRWQLTAWYVLVLAAILAVLGGGLYLAARDILLGEQDKELRLAAEQAVRVTLPVVLEQREEDDRRARGERGEGKKGRDRPPPAHSEEEEILEGERLAVSLIWTFLGTTDGWSTSTAPAWVTAFPHRPSLQRALRGEGPFFTTATDQGETLRLYTLPYRRDGRVVAVVQAGKPITTILANLHQILITLAVAGAAGLVLAALGGLLLANRALVPIHQAFRRQREFVADASHELRTPLAILRASSEVLDRELRAAAPQLAGAPEVREPLDNLLSETERMGRLVGDLLTLARADSGELDLELAEVDAALVAAAAARKAGVLAQAKGIALETALPPRLPVEADAGRLEQLLLILLDNAVKYTDAGGRVTLEASARGNRVEFRVSDTGVGIPPADLPRIFDRFYRVDKARSRQWGGAGLGLAIARWIVDAHGGTIHVESAPGQGTTFTVSLPARHRGAAPAPAPGPARGSL